MKQYFDVLRTCPLFHGLTDSKFSAVLPCLGARTALFDVNDPL